MMCVYVFAFCCMCILCICYVSNECVCVDLLTQLACAMH